jgi:uncharacterized membrane protein
VTSASGTRVVVGPQLARAALAGAATGCRSFTGLAALALTTPRAARSQPDRTLRRRWVRAVTTLGAVQELVADKLPNAPSRLEPPGLVARAACGAAAGAIVGRRADEAAAEMTPPAWRRPAAGAAVALAAALGTSWLGAHWRGYASSVFGTDRVGAVIEDAVALALAGAAVTR